MSGIAATWMQMGSDRISSHAQGDVLHRIFHGSSTSPKVLTESTTRSQPKSSPLSARRCVWKREPERYAAYTREYLGWGVFALMTR